MKIIWKPRATDRYDRVLLINNAFIYKPRGIPTGGISWVHWCQRHAGTSLAAITTVVSESYSEAMPDPIT